MVLVFNPFCICDIYWKIEWFKFSLGNVWESMPCKFSRLWSEGSRGAHKVSLPPFLHTPFEICFVYALEQVNWSVSFMQLWGFVYASKYEEVLAMSKTEAPGICRFWIFTWCVNQMACSWHFIEWSLFLWPLVKFIWQQYNGEILCIQLCSD